MKTVNFQRRYDGWDVIQTSGQNVMAFSEDLQMVYISDYGELNLLHRTCGPMARRLTFVTISPR